MQFQQFHDEVQQSPESSVCKDSSYSIYSSQEQTLINEDNILIKDDRELRSCTEILKELFKKMSCFFVTSVYNFGFAYLVFCGICVKNLSKCQQLNRSQISLYVLAIIFDFLWSFSVLAMYIIFVGGFFINYDSNQSNQHLYHNWSVNCIMFLVLYTVFVTWKEVFIIEKKEPKRIEEKVLKQREVGFFQYVFSKICTTQNFVSLCLGSNQYAFLEEIQGHVYKQAIAVEKHFKEQMKEICTEEDLDETPFYFALLGDKEKFGLNESPKRSVINGKKSVFDIKNDIRQYQHNKVLGHHQRHIIHNFLQPHYEYTRRYQITNTKNKALLAVLMILAKVILPTLIFIGSIDISIVIFSLIFGGFYMHFVSILYNMQQNDDLKTRNYIFLALKKIVDVQEYGKQKLKEKYIRKKQDKDKDQDAQTLEHSERASKKESYPLLDIASPMSLQSWDMMRHLTLYIDRQKTRQYSFLFGFLVLYGKICFVGFLLCGFNIKLLSQFDYCHEPILLYNIHIDIALISLICLYRIYEGNRFNDTFDEIQVLIHRLQAVYEDLMTLFEFYFIEGLNHKLSNECYRSVIKLILHEAKAAASEKGQDSDGEAKDKTKVQFHNKYYLSAKERVQEMKESMEKISQQVDQDREHHSYKFLGVYDTTFKKALKIVMVVALTFVPNLFHTFSKYMDELT